MSTTGKKKLLVTGALPYPNARPHVGHLGGCYLPADTFVRYKRLAGTEVRFICGSDDHGVAIMITAEKEGKTPAEISQHYNALQKSDFAKLGIEFDIYSGTSRSPSHVERSQEFFLNLHKQGLFEKQITRQFYDTARQTFLADRYVKGTCSFCSAKDQNSDQCENCGNMLDVDTLLDAYSTVSGQPASIEETTHWFIDLSKFADQVEGWLERADVRDHTRNYVKGLLATGLVKRSMTRDISWGVPVPLADPDAKNKVLYVWFDAPIGYVSFTEELCQQLDGSSATYSDWWKSDDTEFLHFIGEDNTIFHCVIWIAMLSAEHSYRLPKGVIVNQFVNFQKPGQEVEKISKSKGTAIFIGDYVDEGGNPDSLRYYMTCIAPEKSRSVYNPEDLKQKHNSDLANTLGNFVNRVVSFSLKHAGETVPAFDAGKLDDLDRQFSSALQKTYTEVTADLENYAFKGALEKIMEFARECNRYIDAQAPWVTRKTDLPKTIATLAQALNAIKFLGVVLLPFIPTSAGKILDIFQIDPKTVTWQSAPEALPAGQAMNKPEILFAKIED